MKYVGDEQVKGEKADVSTPRLVTHGCEIDSKCHQRTVSRRGLTMASFNVNGLWSHLDEIKVFMHDMKIDILALNKTTLDSSIDQQITDISGYSQQRLDRSQFGGVSQYTSETLLHLFIGKTYHWKIWNYSALKFNHQNAGNSWSLHGIDHKTAWLLYLAKLKKFYHTLIRKVKR